MSPTEMYMETKGCLWRHKDVCVGLKGCSKSIHLFLEYPYEIFVSNGQTGDGQTGGGQTCDGQCLGFDSWESW